jgi:uncharacterized protein (TIGR00730 family)
MKRICVFCGSCHGFRPEYGAMAARLGRTLAVRGLGVVYGGGNIGLMGTLADAVLAEHGEVIGVIPQGLVAKELAHQGLSDLRVVSSMHQRKALMADLSDAFIAIPGGYGTLEEFFEAVTWSQLGLHQKPCGLLNVANYYDPLRALLEHATAEGFIRPTHRSLVLVEEDPDRLIDLLAAYRPAEPVSKWIEKEET